ncbi:imidazole glycerol phosphate synthase subunit HisH [Sulfobacillus harzensis]|uniref:Imidazole glycerol phosphate synthase subunit HisH n=1 Tax=Sulfobacillus harzensis TaxID=2729629 RepID=A0A7Y0Q5W7_9FIRM|nr:imidazole glycerol phosphate synthase subunit HisH [Sulfobacillus harzensis]
MHVAIIPLGRGNLGSLTAHFMRLGHRVEIIQDASRERLAADWVILPGVGSMRGAVRHLDQQGILSTLKQARQASVPVLGICLGMQLFYHHSEEGGEGLGWLSGRVPRLSAPILPHIGWNDLEMVSNAPRWLAAFQGASVYFVHEFFVEPADTDQILSSTQYYQTFPSVVQAPGLFGVQFHPELSGDVGAALTEAILNQGGG